MYSLSMHFTKLLVFLCMGQDPSTDLLNRIDDFDSSVRFESALELGRSDKFYSKWLLKNFDKGTPSRQRALLLSVSLLGTSDSLKVLEKVARRSRSSNSIHPYALFLYGMFHPDASADLEKTLKRGANSYQKMCLLLGLCASPHEVKLFTMKKALGREKNNIVRSLYLLLEALRGHTSSQDSERWSDEGVPGLLVGLFASHFPNQLGLTVEQLESLPASTPVVWQEAAKRETSRLMRSWKTLPFAGEHEARVFCLREFAENERREAALWFQEHARTKRAAGWLFGHMVEMDLGIPLSLFGKHESAQVGAIFLWASFDFAAAQDAAILRLSDSRKKLAAASNPLDVWPAAALVALAGQKVDSLWFEKVMRSEDGAIRRRFHPLWLLLSDGFSDVTARQEELVDIAREFGVGTAGFMDEEGWRLAAIFLLSGSRISEVLPQLSGHQGLLESPLEHAKSDELYSDLMVLLQSSLYRWKLPSLR